MSTREKELSILLQSQQTTAQPTSLTNELLRTEFLSDLTTKLSIGRAEPLIPEEFKELKRQSFEQEVSEESELSKVESKSISSIIQDKAQKTLTKITDLRQPKSIIEAAANQDQSNDQDTSQQSSTKKKKQNQFRKKLYWKAYQSIQKDPYLGPKYFTNNGIKAKKLKRFMKVLKRQYKIELMMEKNVDVQNEYQDEQQQWQQVQQQDEEILSDELFPETIPQTKLEDTEQMEMELQKGAIKKKRKIFIDLEKEEEIELEEQKDQNQKEQQRQMKDFKYLNKDSVPTLIYDDGKIKKFGKKIWWEGDSKYIITKKDQFIYEKPKRKIDRKGWKTALQREQEKPLTENQIQQKFKEFVSYNKQEFQIYSGEMKPWKRYYEKSEIPKSFYFPKSFKQPFGPVLPKDFVMTPYSLFRLFFDQEVYDLILEQTNLKLEQEIQRGKREYDAGLRSNIKNRKRKITQNDLQAYFASTIVMGINRMPSVKDYWQKNHIFKTNQEEVSTKATYQFVNQFLHLADNDDPLIQQDPIGKIRKLLNLLNKRFTDYFYPGEYMALDEGMIPFGGKIFFKVFNPDKPNKWGIKEYVLCDSTGYTFHIKPYCGGDEATDSSQSKTTQLVLGMLENYQNKYHKVVMDNYYNSPQMYEELKKRKIGALGVVRPGRLRLDKQNLQQVMDVHKGQQVNFLQEDINSVIFFKGSYDKEIAIMSNYVDNSLIKDNYWEVLFHLKSQIANEKQPLMSALYNKFKGGVDKRNGFLAAHRYKKRTTKWWRPCFTRFFDTAIVNSWIIYNYGKNEKQTITQKAFRQMLVQQMVQTYKPIDNQFFYKNEEKNQSNPQLSVPIGDIQQICKEWNYMEVDDKEYQTKLKECQRKDELIISKQKEKISKIDESKNFAVQLDKILFEKKQLRSSDIKIQQKDQQKVNEI